MSEYHTHIFVEGIADVKFITDYLKFLNLSNIYVSKIGGVGEIINTKKDFQVNLERGLKNILIVDADLDFNNRKNEIENLGVILDYEIDLFIFPNNSENGDLETLLENIINQNNNSIFECWNSYEDCLNYNDNKYTTPARKTKIYAYLEALLGETNKEKDQIKEKERNYLNKDHWDLDSEYLEPLKTFLLKLQ